MTAVDLLASEYGWSKDYILSSVYPAEYFALRDLIQKRQLNRFIDNLQIQVITDPAISEKGRNDFIHSTNRLRDGGYAGPPDRPFDRAKFEELRKTFNGNRGRGPKRV